MSKVDVALGGRERQMLELLARGASIREMAGKLGYGEGTMRVYLHNLYRKIGVSNKTRAAIWFLGRHAPAQGSAKAPAAVPGLGPPAGETFGDMAIRTDLLASLGVMRIYLGAHGRLWEIANRLKGVVADPALELRRQQSRLLWEALLRGDFVHGKRLYDEGNAERLVADSPSDGVVLAAMLLIGGYTAAAAGLLRILERHRRTGHRVTEREFAFLQTLRSALEPDANVAIARLHRQTTENTAFPVLKHLAMTALFYTNLLRRDRDRARATADALLAEAESVRQQLQAMGERPLFGEGKLPEPARPEKPRIATGTTKRDKLARAN